MTRQLTKKPKFSAVIKSDAYQNLIESTLGDVNRSQNFVAAISSAVATNPDLQACDAGTILSGALLAESLKLAHSPQMGHYYLVPFGSRHSNTKQAQFQLGYKGYIQLAIRSGQYQKLNVIEIKEGELKSYDPLLEEINVELISDPNKREVAKTIGYFAFFKLNNGFQKAIYWSIEKMENHATTYSQAYRAKKGFSFWEKNFDEMAKKTMLRQLISKWGIMSVEMQQTGVFEKDMAVLEEDGSYEYVDNQIEATNSRVNVDEVKEQNLNEDKTVQEIDLSEI